MFCFENIYVYYAYDRTKSNLALHLYIYDKFPISCLCCWLKVLQFYVSIPFYIKKKTLLQDEK